MLNKLSLLNLHYGLKDAFKQKKKSIELASNR